MQASKIMPRKVYAIRRGNALLRFHVDAVVTRRTQGTGSPHDYKSTVEGFILEDKKNGEQPTVITLNADGVLGPYEEYAELAERKRQEEAEKKREADEAEAARLHLWQSLYDKVGLPRPNNPNDYKQPFRLSYGSIDISGEGITLLSEYLERH